MIVLHDGRQASADELRAWVKAVCARRAPRRIVEFRAELLHNETGKLFAAKAPAELAGSS